MEQKTGSLTNDTLPTGIEQIQFRDLMAKSPEKLWYVLITKTEKIKKHDLGYTYIYTNEWVWAYTKSWARELARKAQDDGHMVVDIFKSNKTHIMHKYRGL